MQSVLTCVVAVTRLCTCDGRVGQEPRSHQVGSAAKDESPRSQWRLQTRLDQQVGHVTVVCSCFILIHWCV